MEPTPQKKDQENDKMVYQAPDIEEVISLNEIDQEVLYAGNAGSNAN